MKHLALLLCLATAVPALEPGFKELFDGRSLNGWSHEGNWGVVDGVIARTGRGGSLVYRRAKVPDDFELRFDWKVAKGCNSGVYYRPGQYEYQLLDNAHSPYAENPRQAAGSLFFCQAPTRDVVRPHGEWNEARIVCKGTVIQHWLNGVKVIDFDYADPRWAAAVRLLRIRGGELSARGAHLSLQDHGADVWFRNLRWRALPADEPLLSENLQPMPVPSPALAKELERVQRMLAEQGRLKRDLKMGYEELRRYPAAEAYQGVAVDAGNFYAISNRAIGKYRRDSGERVAAWEEVKAGRLKHLNAGLLLDGLLFCAHSNYPEQPPQSSVEVWETAGLKHRQTIDLSHERGSLTWIDRRGDFWYACFAEYAKTGDPANTRLVKFDKDWRRLMEWRFPREAVVRFGANSSSGGGFGPGGFLYFSGHDARELGLVELPENGAAPVWLGALAVNSPGQAFAWDPAMPGQLFGIERKTREVILGRVNGP
jgi:hypothetical protein